MIAWDDIGIILGRRRFGETDLIVTALTRDHGRHAGLVKGGVSRRMRGELEPGSRVSLSWHARLDEHLGTFRHEALAAVPLAVLEAPARLAALVSACGLLDLALPEREPHPDLFALAAALLDRLDGADWAAVYADFERGLLEAMGFGLHLDACAATGATDDLRWVSPKTGCAVSGAAGAAWAARLLPFPEVFRRRGVAAMEDVVAGLAVTGYFLERHVLEGRGFPEARGRLIERLSKARVGNDENG